MANFTKIPLLNPIKFVPATTTPGLNFDDDWACKQIKSWQKKAYFKQKWVETFTTPLVMESTIAPTDLKVYKGGAIVGTLTWNPVYAAVPPAGTLYLLTLDLDTIIAVQGEGIYYLYGEVTNGGSYMYAYISEPIHVKKTPWPVTSVVTYAHNKNAQGVYFPVYDNLVFRLLVEAQVCDFLPDSDTYDYVNQNHDPRILGGVPYRKFRLLVANAPGVADYLVDLLNRIFCLNTVTINGMEYVKENGAKWDPQRTHGYPLAGWVLDILPAINVDSLEYNDVSPIIPRPVVVFDEDNEPFGGNSGNSVRILELQDS